MSLPRGTITTKLAGFHSALISIAFANTGDSKNMQSLRFPKNDCH